jgi:hypothetical protein
VPSNNEANEVRDRPDGAALAAYLGVRRQ